VSTLKLCFSEIFAMVFLTVIITITMNLVPKSGAFALFVAIALKRNRVSI
jgi:hypothetical protein